MRRERGHPGRPMITVRSVEKEECISKVGVSAVLSSLVERSIHNKEIKPSSLQRMARSISLQVAHKYSCKVHGVQSEFVRVLVKAWLLHQPFLLQFQIW